MVLFQIAENKTVPFDSAEAWASDAFLCLGVLGLGTFMLLGITSLPSVSSSLNWREFRFIQVQHAHVCVGVCVFVRVCVCVCVCMCV